VRPALFICILNKYPLIHNLIYSGNAATAGGDAVAGNKYQRKYSAALLNFNGRPGCNAVYVKVKLPRTIKITTACWKYRIQVDVYVKHQQVQHKTIHHTRS